MSATVLPDIDYSKLEELRKRLPDLSELDISAPKMEDVGKRAEKAVDRLLGRRRAPRWPWVAAAIGLVAVIGLLAAWVSWNRRVGWEASSGLGYDSGEDTGPGTGMAQGMGATAGLGTEPGKTNTDAGWDAGGEGGGLTAAEASLTTRDQDERV